jgi:hypothetical protein
MGNLRGALIRFTSLSSTFGCGSRKAGPASVLKGTETRIRPVSRSFFEFARPAAPPRPRWGIQTVPARHLFS